jgi:hypothetical protein
MKVRLQLLSLRFPEIQLRSQCEPSFSFVSSVSKDTPSLSFSFVSLQITRQDKTPI